MKEKFKAFLEFWQFKRQQALIPIPIETEPEPRQTEKEPEILIEFNGENIYEFIKLKEVIGLSETPKDRQTTRENYLMLMGKGIIKIEKGFQLKGRLR